MKSKTNGKQHHYHELLEGCKPPEQLWSNRRIGNKANPEDGGVGVLHLAGRGSREAPVLFISGCVHKEDVRAHLISEPMALKGPAGALFMRSMSRVGFTDDDWFYTALVKYAVPHDRPGRPDIRWGTAALEDEIRTIKPKIIVCLGRVALDWVMAPEKFPVKDVQGAFLFSDKWQAEVCVIDTMMTPLLKPEYLERFYVDLRNIRLELDSIRGKPRVQVTQNYTTITTTAELTNLMMRILAKGYLDLAVDCEWHGQTAYGGRLRSLQFAWAPGEAACVRLMDDKLNYAFDQPMEVVRRIMAATTRERIKDPETGQDRWKLRFIGHNAASDMPWLHDHLGIDVYRRFSFDTMYAQHTLNEYSDLKLERLAVRYTDLGRYDLALTMWKKAHNFDEEDNTGYGLVPDSILTLYALRDVDTTFRVKDVLLQDLRAQKLEGYYFDLLLPFVTDGFFEMVDSGLPIHLDTLDEMRDTFSRNANTLIQEFRLSIQKQANLVLLSAMQRHDPGHAAECFARIVKLCREALSQTSVTTAGHPAVATARELLKQFVGAKNLEATMPIFDHMVTASLFNINSAAQVKRWLFKVMKLRPIKTTKRDGLQLTWDKVESLPKDRQGEFAPSADKQTIKVYAEQNPIIAQLQELKSVATIVKCFLRGPDEEGKEQGLHRWVQSDGRIHTNFSLTETARPRTWKPNILNFPKAVTKPIEAAFHRVNKKLGLQKYQELKMRGLAPAEIKKEVLATIRKPTALRAIVHAPPGWVTIDADLKTAEVVALMYQAGDINGIKVLTEPDTQFACIDKANPKKVARLCYNENSCYPKDQQDPKLCISQEDPRILRRPDGSVIHPKRDLHWEMAESVAGKLREKLDERLFRDGVGKVSNFSVPYGASAPLLMRLIEANTGRKPPAGTGEKMIRTWEDRYPFARDFLERMEKAVKDPGWWRSLSGRVRHFGLASLEDLDGLSHWTYQGILSPLARQARNFPMQELVAATTAKALIRFIDESRKRGFQARIGILLYDAMTCFCPLEEVKEVTALLKDCLTSIVWPTPQLFSFEVDLSYSFRWGVKLTPDEKNLVGRFLKVIANASPNMTTMTNTQLPTTDYGFTEMHHAPRLLIVNGVLGAHIVCKASPKELQEAQVHQQAINRWLDSQGIQRTNAESENGRYNKSHVAKGTFYEALAVWMGLNILPFEHLEGYDFASLPHRVMDQNGRFLNLLVAASSFNWDYCPQPQARSERPVEIWDGTAKPLREPGEGIARRAIEFGLPRRLVDGNGAGQYAWQQYHAYVAATVKHDVVTYMGWWPSQSIATAPWDLQQFQTDAKPYVHVPYSELLPMIELFQQMAGFDYATLKTAGRISGA